MKKTLCWTCENAVPSKDGTRGCPWSRRFEPVPGWKAKATTIRENGVYIYDSFEVIECPMYERDNTLGNKSRRQIKAEAKSKAKRLQDATE